MAEILAVLYPWIKALHVVSVISWMAGLFYLPRLFVHHVDRAGRRGDMHETFLIMEYKLFRFIMNPAMVATWVFGLLLILTPDVVDWAAVWPWTKATAVLIMTWFHHWLGRKRKEFVTGTSRAAGRTFRLMNELPSVLLIIIVFSVIVRF